MGFRPHKKLVRKLSSAICTKLVGRKQDGGPFGFVRRVSRGREKYGKVQKGYGALSRSAAALQNRHWSIYFGAGICINQHLQPTKLRQVNTINADAVRTFGLLVYQDIERSMRRRAYALLSDQDVESKDAHASAWGP